MSTVAHSTPTPQARINWNSQPEAAGRVCHTSHSAGTVPPARYQVLVSLAAPGSYLVEVIDNEEQTLRVVNPDLLSKRHALALAEEVRKQLALCELAAAAQDNRLARAMSLVATGKVHRNGHGWIVDSQTETDVSYYVGERNGCTCPDATYNKPAGGCKHELAVKLFRRMSHNSELDDLLQEARQQPHVRLTDEQIAEAEAEEFAGRYSWERPD